MSTAKSKVTRYSRVVEGSTENHDHPVRFDLTRGCLGITEFTVDEGVSGRILLTPKQVEALIKFVQKQ